MKKIKVSELLLKITYINHSINLKKKYLYENEIKNIQKELNISYNNSKDIVETVYSESFDNKYKKIIKIINNISEKLINNDNYDLEDFYTLSIEEYSLIYENDIL